MTQVQLRGQWFDYADVLVDVMIGYACNVQCDYCSITNEMRREAVSTSTLLTQLQEARRSGAVKVAFGGGEPTIRAGLLPLVRWCHDRGYRVIKVSSNGLMYSYPEYAQEASEAGVNQFHFSLMAHTPELYTRVMGRADAFSLVHTGLSNVMKLGHRPVADLIIKHDTWMWLPEIVSHWAAEGVETFNLWLVSLSDRNRDNLESLPRVRDMITGITGAMDRGRELGVTVKSRHIPRCMLQGYEDHVADLRDDKVLVITPRTSFALWESKISPNVYGPRCDGCAFQHDACLGLRKDYLDRYGDAEVVPQLAIGA